MQYERVKQATEQLEQFPEYQLLLIFVAEYRHIYGITYDQLRIGSNSEGSCIAQGEGPNLLMALCHASEWTGEWGELLCGDAKHAYVLLQMLQSAIKGILLTHPQRYEQTRTIFEGAKLN